MIAITHSPSPNMDRALRAHAEVTIDVALAIRQHEGYCKMLARAGAVVRTLDVNRVHPDCVFVEDTAIVLDEVAILTSMGAPSRREEPAGIEPELRKYREVVRTAAEATLEGGDVLRVAKKLFVGATARTNAAGIESLAAAVRRYGYQVQAVPIRGCLHLKTACTALPDGTLLINPAWIDPKGLPGFECLAVPDEEPYGANVVLIGKTVCLATAHPKTADMIRKRGFEVEATDISEFAKADGATTCLSLLLTAS